jgi:hypothetical protein
MPRDSLGRYTTRRPRLVGAGRRLRLVGATYDGPEVGGVRTGTPFVLGGPAVQPAPAPEPKATRSSRSDS